jgi:hypothetical protein
LTKKDIEQLESIKADHDDDDDDDDYSFNAAIEFSPDVIYPGGDEWHEGYVDDVYILGQNGDTSDPLNNMIGKRDWLLLLHSSS